MSISPIRVEQLPQLTEALAEAFLDNPLNCIVVGRSPARRLRSNRVGMELTLRSALDNAMILVAESFTRAGTRGVVGGLIALPPGTSPLPAPPLLDQVWALFRQGVRVASRWGQVYSELTSLCPVEPHWYLSTLGVRPKQRRMGFASALMEHWLVEVDRSRQPAYLETDRRENLDFYENRGFCVTEERVLFRIPIWRMRRPGAATAEAAGD